MNHALSFEALTAGLRRVEAEADAIAALGAEPQPLDHDMAFALVRRWLAVPMEHKPRCHYVHSAGTASLSACSPTGFLVWSSTYLGGRLYPELVRRQPSLAKAFRAQFLEVVAQDYDRLSHSGGLGYPYAQFLARGTLELVDRVLGDGCRREVIS